MLLEQIESRIIAGFTITFIFVTGVMFLKLKAEQHKVEVLTQKLRYEQSVNNELKNQINQLQSELSECSKQLELMKKNAETINKYTKKQSKVQHNKVTMKAKVKKVIKDIKPKDNGALSNEDNRKVIRLLNSIFDCNE